MPTPRPDADAALNVLATVASRLRQYHGLSTEADAVAAAGVILKEHLSLYLAQMNQLRRQVTRLRTRKVYAEPSLN